MWHDLQEQAKVGRMLIGRTLQCDELALVWTIDRREVIHNSYRLVDGALTLRPDYFDMQGWPPGEHGGWCYGLFDGARLIGVAALERRFIGQPADMLQLVFLHVSRDYRDQGLGRQLFMRAAAVARNQGARRMYVSATPSEHTIHFYLGLGCELSPAPDPALLALEPEDIHLEFALK
jgi:GNAT superfamily N-acetyltransferase